MKITRCESQGPDSLESFYGTWSRRGPGVGVDGEAMISLLRALHDVADERKVWGLTSHAVLNLLQSDDSRAPQLVRVFAPAGGGFDISYRMPAVDAPWPEARVTGHAESVPRAVKMLLEAMDRSEGWTSTEPQPVRLENGPPEAGE